MSGDELKQVLHDLDMQWAEVGAMSAGLIAPPHLEREGDGACYSIRYVDDPKRAIPRKMLENAYQRGFERGKETAAIEGK